MNIVSRFGFLLLIASTSLHADAPQPNNFDRLKALVGSWHGTLTPSAGPAMPAHAEFQLLADNSVVMSRLGGAAMPHEMATTFYVDDGTLMLTHFCAMHNQPRMVLAPSSDAGRLTFTFRDGTNLQSTPGHMDSLSITLDSPNHHIEEWTFTRDGQQTTARFDLHRKS